MKQVDLSLSGYISGYIMVTSGHIMIRAGHRPHKTRKHVWFNLENFFRTLISLKIGRIRKFEAIKLNSQSRAARYDDFYRDFEGNIFSVRYHPFFDNFAHPIRHSSKKVNKQQKQDGLFWNFKIFSNSQSTSRSSSRDSNKSSNRRQGEKL